jgi:predicted phosphoribosyltransferase
MEEIHCVEWVPRPYPAFNDRWDAGEKLVSFVNPKFDPDSVILALPRGGVPVAAALARSIRAPLIAFPVRKLPIPWSPEAGFGAITIDGQISLNDRIMAQAPMTEREIKEIAEETLKEINRRAEAYGWSNDPSLIRDRTVYMVDDGLASGYSMIAAMNMVKRMAPAKTILCVPCAPSSSVSAMKEHFNEIYCLVIQTQGSFAVASYYYDFRDLSDEEVIMTLEQVRVMNSETRDARA